MKKRISDVCKQMAHSLHFLCWKASYKAYPSSHKVVQFPQLTWCVPLWDVKFREILGQYCFYRSQCLVASVVNSFGGVCVISIFICTPYPYGRHFFGLEGTFLNLWFSFHLTPLELVFWHILAALSSFYSTDLLESAVCVELWHLKTCCLSTIHHLSGSVPWGMGEGASTKLQRPICICSFPSPSTLTVSRKVQGFSKCTATTYIAHQD